MTMRVRLALAFVAVVLLPLVAAALLVGRTMPAAATDRAEDRVQAAATAAAAELAALCAQVQVVARSTALEAAARGPVAAVQAAVASRTVDFAVVRDNSGRVLAQRGTPPTVAQDCGQAQSSALAGMATVSVTGRPGQQRRVLVGLTPQELAARIRIPVGNVDVVLLDRSGVVSTTTTPEETRRLSLARQQLREDDRVIATGDFVVAVVPPEPGLPFRVVVIDERPDPDRLLAVILAVMTAAVLAAALMGRRLAAVTTKPLVEVSSAAARIAAGDLETRVPVRGRDEIGRLAAAFNDMTERLSKHVGELEESRNELRRNLGRLGETLSGTHDLNRILGVILDTALETAHAAGGVIYLVSANQEELFLMVGRGLERRGVTAMTRLAVGEGLLGGVARTGEPVCVALDESPVGLSSHEPTAEEVIAVPLKSSGRTIGVLAVYDRTDGSFSSDDLATLGSFSSQATVAVDNVLLHQEAQRLSVTDGLTGLANYRLFQQELAREVERSLRFGRSSGLLMLDVDNFKAVNDTYGHQRGDAVLVELAARVQSEIREVDTLARYGGEELVVILPETGAEGVARLAERICEAVRRQPFVADGSEPLRVTVSIGGAVLPDHASTSSDLVRVADEAMYAAKQAGRDTWRLLATPSGATTGSD